MRERLMFGDFAYFSIQIHHGVSTIVYQRTLRHIKYLRTRPDLGIGVVMYNYIKVKDVKASQPTADSLPDRINKEWKMGKKSSDKFNPNVGGESPRVGGEINDEEAPLITSRLSHIGRTQLGNHAA
ncbi:hypothetical protein Bca4012_093815 [Brassica carinata]